MTKKPKLFGKTAPYTGAYYFQESLRLTEILAGEQTVRLPQQPHLFDDIEMFLVTGGEGILTVNGVELTLPEGSFAWLFPFHVRSLRPKGKEPLHMSFCRFSLGMLLYMNISQRYMQMSISALEYAPPCLPLGPEDAAAVAEIFRELNRETERQEQDCELVQLSCILRLVAMFERRAISIIEKNQEAARTDMWNALQYIQVHFNKPISSASVAECFGISVSELGSGLRLLTGRNFSQILNATRIRNACAMMQFKELSLPFIAGAVGYTTVPAFYRQFKSIKGCTPDQYRNSHTNIDLNRWDSVYAVFIYINENYREPITAESAAKALFIGESTIASLMEKHFHRTFSQLLTLVRLWVAAGLLLGTSLPAGDIAIASGFNSVRTFTRCFTEEFGASPSAYRRSGKREGRHTRFGGRESKNEGRLLSELVDDHGDQDDCAHRHCLPVGGNSQ